MINENILKGWTGPSSPTEQDKQERTERMIRQAITKHGSFAGYLNSLSIYAKGSYANNTNVKTDSDVDIVVEYTGACYSIDADPAKGGRPVNLKPYKGPWTPHKLREEIGFALEAEFSGAVMLGSTAFEVNATSARVNADVVPSFSHKLYHSDGSFVEGTRVCRKDGSYVYNYPKLQLQLGRDKNLRTQNAYKKTVRILKRLENELVAKGLTEEVPSYALECLIYNCPEEYFSRSTWRETMRGCLAHIFNSSRGIEPAKDRWMEANGVNYLFHNQQKWTREQIHTFSSEAWDYMGF